MHSLRDCGGVQVVPEFHSLAQFTLNHDVEVAPVFVRGPEAEQRRARAHDEPMREHRCGDLLASEPADCES